MRVARRSILSVVIALTVLLILALICGSYFIVLLYKLPAIPDGITGETTAKTSSGRFVKDTITRYPVKLEVKNTKQGETVKVGISTDSDELNFGRLYLNMTARKFIIIQNNAEYASVVHVISRGESRDIVSSETPEFILRTGDERHIVLVANGTKEGNYTGEMTIAIRTPRYKGLAGVLLGFEDIRNRMTKRESF